MCDIDQESLSTIIRSVFLVYDYKGDIKEEIRRLVSHVCEYTRNTLGNKKRFEYKFKSYLDDGKVYKVYEHFRVSIPEFELNKPESERIITKYLIRLITEMVAFEFKTKAYELYGFEFNQTIKEFSETLNLF